MSSVKACITPLSFFILGLVVVGLVGFASQLSGTVEASSTFAAPQPQTTTHRFSSTDALTVFSNPAAIAPADRVSNNAGTNPGVPASNYPSAIVVTGLTGTVTKITVSLSITSTFPDDIDILLRSPTSEQSLVISDAGGSGNITNRAFVFDQAAATPFPDAGTDAAPVPAGTYQPANYIGLATPEPSGQDNFPAPGGGLLAYPTGFNIFNGINPNGTWNLFVVDDQVIDTNSLPGGWSIDITTASVPATDAAMDMNGDGRSDFVVVRNVGGGSSGQVRWFYNHAGTADATIAKDWGIATDFFMADDFDGDLKDDITVWRPSASLNQSRFYVLKSSDFTALIDVFGQSGDDPTVVGDYDGDGKADFAVYRGGLASGDPSTWFYRGSLTPANITYIPWGQNGDFPAPGDYDGDSKNDFVIQRNAGGGLAGFWTRLATGVVQPVILFGTPTDVINPGDYDGDGKTDIMVSRGSGGQILWFYRSSFDSSINWITFGLSASDFRVQGDFDGDGKTDVGVWRPNADPTQNFFLTRNSSNGAVQFFELGQNGDYPVGNFNTH